MSVLSFNTHVLRNYFLFSTVGFTFICDEGEQAISLICSVLDEVWCVCHESWLICCSTVFGTSCHTRPSEYAYHSNSVNRAESASANCRNYPGGPAFQEQYIHCDGTQLQLTDFNLGQEQYQSSEYYWWITGSDAQLLFIFPTRVSLTIITLHYYSDSLQGLPRLILLCCTR